MCNGLNKIENLLKEIEDLKDIIELDDNELKEQHRELLVHYKIEKEQRTHFEECSERSFKKFKEGQKRIKSLEETNQIYFNLNHELFDEGKKIEKLNEKFASEFIKIRDTYNSLYDEIRNLYKNNGNGTDLEYEISRLYKNFNFINEHQTDNVDELIEEFKKE